VVADAPAATLRLPRPAVACRIRGSAVGTRASGLSVRSMAPPGSGPP